MREFNAENIKFWREVNAYHDLVDECGFDEEQSPSPDKVKQVMELAKQLYDTFISDEAPLQVFFIRSHVDSNKILLFKWNQG